MTWSICNQSAYEFGCGKTRKVAVTIGVFTSSEEKIPAINACRALYGRMGEFSRDFSCSRPCCGCSYHGHLGMRNGVFALYSSYSLPNLAYNSLSSKNLW